MQLENRRMHPAYVPETVSRTFWEIWAAVLYLVRVSGLDRV